MTEFVDRLVLLIQAKTEAAQQNIRNLEKGLRAFQGLAMSVALSMMFTGMAMKRFFEGMLQNIITTFMSVSGEQSYVSEKIYELQAAWIYFLSSIMMAGEEMGVFDKWVEILKKIADWFNSLDDKWKVFILNVVIWGLIAGVAMSILGQAILGLLAPMAILFFFYKMKMEPALAKMVIMNLAIAAVILIVLAAVVLLFIIWNKDISTTEKILWTIVIVLGVILLIFLVLGIGVSLPFILIMLGIMIVLGGFALLVNKVGGVKNAFSALGIFIMAIFAVIADIIEIVLISPLLVLIGIINLLIMAAHALGRMTDIKTIEPPELFGASKSVWEKRNELLEVAEKEKAEKKKAKEEEGETQSILDKFTNFKLPENALDGLTLPEGALKDLKLPENALDDIKPSEDFMKNFFNTPIPDGVTPPVNQGTKENNFNLTINGNVISEGELKEKMIGWMEEYMGGATGSPFN
jgi:hypothetical protein